MRLAAAPGAAQQGDMVALGGDQVAGAVGRSIIEGEAFEIGMAAPEHRQIGELVRHRLCFIIGAEEQRGTGRRRGDRPLGTSGQRAQDQRVAKEGPGDRDQAQGQNDQQNEVDRGHP